MLLFDSPRRASDRTAEGRAQNRRIDVIIAPSAAVPAVAAPPVDRDPDQS